MLGHRPITRNALFGRPLININRDGADRLLAEVLSRGVQLRPGYGILGGDGRSLFIADAVNQKNYVFNLADDPRGTRNRLTDTMRCENETLIHDLVVSVNQFYGLGEYP